MQVAFSGQHKQSVYFRAVQMAFQPSAQGLINRIGLAAGIFLIYGFYTNNLAVTQGVNIWEPVRILMHILVLFVGLFIAFEANLMALLAAFRLWRDPAVRSPMRGHVTMQGITFLPADRQVRWDAFIRYRKSADVLVLSTSATRFLVMPKHFFRSDADWEKFIKLARDRVIPPAKPARPPFPGIKR